MSHDNFLESFELLKISDTLIQAAFKPTHSTNFGTTNYDYYFNIEFNGFNYGSSCTISSVVLEITTTNSPGTGDNNTVSPAIKTCSGDRVLIGLTDNIPFSSFWGGLGLASDNQWQNN